MKNPHRRPNHRPHSRIARGFGLIEALIAMLILTFGMVALTQFQSKLIGQTTDSQLRATANQLAGELMGMVLVDAANAACYTLPQDGTCNNAAAKTRTADWADDVAAALPGTVTTTSTLNDPAAGQLKLVITWTGKAGSDTRRLESITDVR
jgi:type IV pilus assembly protein PilV